MQKLENDQRGFGGIGILIVLAVILMVGSAGWYVYRTQLNAKRAPTSSSASPKIVNSSTMASTKVKASSAANGYSGWKTYSSSKEKITFKYPPDWTVDTIDQYSSNDPNNTDYIALKSPDGKAVVRWTSLLDGFGNEHGDGYPLNTVVDKTPIAGAHGDYVVSGITTLDGKSFFPWMAVENDANYGILSSGVSGNLDLFEGRNNINPTTGTTDTALFSTCGPRTEEGSPSLSQNQAQAFLSSSDMQLAKLILESLSY